MHLAEVCDGTITSRRKTVNGLEESVLDYFVMCQELFAMLSSMKIEEKRSLVLSRYSKNNGKVVVTPSDHNILYCKFNLKWCNKIFSERQRYEIFNYKNVEGIQKFQEFTSSDVLSKCLKGVNIVQESNKWLKCFLNFLHRSFNKIRITKPRQQNEVILHMREKACLMQKIEVLELCLGFVNSEISQDIINRIVLIKLEVEETDKLISQLISEKNVGKIKEHLSNLSVSGNFGAQNMWGLKRKLNFKVTDVP